MCAQLISFDIYFVNSIFQFLVFFYRIHFPTLLMLHTLKWTRSLADLAVGGREHIFLGETFTRQKMHNGYMSFKRENKHF